MSRFFSSRHRGLEPYVPGEQPVGQRFVKLNTNESPYPPSARVIERASAESALLNLYPDPDCRALREKMAAHLDVAPENLLAVNGSDEALNFAVAAFGDETHPFVFPDITYGFYPVFCQANRVPFKEIPLDASFHVRPEDYMALGKNIILANPNAPVGTALARTVLEQIAASNPDSVVIIDEAYVDFGAESCVPLIGKYSNLLVVQTFSKSRSLAGARLGFAIGDAALIADLNTLRCSTNPYNVNRMTMAAGIGAIQDAPYYEQNCREIAKTREYVREELEQLGFELTASQANFVFCRSDRIAGADLYAGLRKRGVLVRHFDLPRIADYNRVTIGSREQMDTFLDAVRDTLTAYEEKKR